MSPDLGWQGYAPTVVVSTRNPEAEKYRQMWQQPDYRVFSPGEAHAATFLEVAKPAPNARVLDLGCGTGRGGLALALLGRMDVTLVDFVDNCLDDDVRAALTTQADRLRFVLADLEQPLPVVAEYVYCSDTLEHIPPEKVDAVLDHILLAGEHVFLAINTAEDHCGELIGETLHLTVRPAAWWLGALQARNFQVHWSRTDPRVVLVYGSAWRPGEAVTKMGQPNTELEDIRANVAHNVAQGWTPVIPHPTNDLDCMILGGGPSLNGSLDEIRALREQGVKLLTLNGTYHWALEHGLTPSAAIVVDARPFNARFTHPVVDECRYLIGSQVHPSVLEGLPKDRTYLWHASPEPIKDLLDAAYPEGWYAVPGGSSVLLRTLPLMRMLGYRRFILFGCDSCLLDEAHHAYAQPENDGAPIVPVLVGGRFFRCHVWMVSQAHELLELIRMMGTEMELDIRGDGLLAWMLQYSASLEEVDNA
jgi:SAM-dependent methyltransferase